jgi:oligosaccharide repeat unit polymerase
MSDFPFPLSSSTPADGQPLGVDGAWPITTAVRVGHTLTSGSFRPRQELPVYCNPIALFLAVWILMLACLCVHVSYAIYPNLATPFLIFLVSTASLLLGFFACTAVLERQETKTDSTLYVLDVSFLRRLNLLFCALALALIALNWVTSGPPPAIGDPSTYLTYGKLKQVLFPLLTCVAVNATLDSSRLCRYFFIAFGLGWLGLYVARGILLVTFLQMFFLYSLRSRMSRKRQYLFSLGAFAIAIAGMTVIGNLRTAHDVFIDFLEIRAAYSDWPMAFLWVVSYISIPFSNLCWMVVHGSSHGPTLSFLYSLLPSFIAPPDPYSDINNGLNIIDGASTYLQAWALDFSYLGIYFVNLLIGIGCGWLVARSYPRHILILAIFLTSISLLFFSDYFFLLAIVIQVLLQAFVEKRCFYWQHSGIP